MPKAARGGPQPAAPPALASGDGPWKDGHLLGHAALGRRIAADHTLQKKASKLGCVEFENLVRFLSRKHRALSCQQECARCQCHGIYRITISLRCLDQWRKLDESLHLVVCRLRRKILCLTFWFKFSKSKHPKPFAF